ncbi:DUF3046 domain-containing protein [Microbacterium dextranolyticum]|uniref:DUF3046 domain-containing protein n=1 Tax=Microbacterium dextranolyticum TaxID=36806 RepID=A0A9W6HPS0_9MICO|nr:DUF3046 domain-containing protein [Microbacterium dextranolyticum]MBM7462420.1 hypothetical protein [Microbacterium dextranolyticum]GLJ96747.1 hypothetical protein GCM10017591_28100 [Microbacterium dextranolyticum]
MRRSEFHRAVDDEFGARATSVLTDLTLGGVGYRTAAQAIADGVDPRIVWRALCDETEVPESRRHGVGLLDPRR